jgi:hypothetical protein
MRIAENKVRIEGILSETNIEYGSFQKEGKTVECIRGTIKVLVNQVINGVPTTNEIPVALYAQKLKNDGTSNPAYESIERVMRDYISIAASETGEAGADRVRITGGQITMNEYYNANKQLVSFPRIQTSFVTKIKKDECKPEASFAAEMVVGSKSYKTDAEGNELEPRVFVIKGVMPIYGEKVQVVEFVAANENVADIIDNNWEKGDTVKFLGRLNFSSKTDTILEEVDFGEPQERVRTISVSELLITGGSKDPLDGELAYTNEEIAKGLAERTARLEAQKEKDLQKAQQRKAPAPSTEASKGSFDLGF